MSVSFLVPITRHHPSDFWNVVLWSYISLYAHIQGDVYTKKKKQWRNYSAQWFEFLCVHCLSWAASALWFLALADTLTWKICSEVCKEVAKLQNTVFLLNRKLGEVPCCSAKPEVITSNPSGFLCTSSDKDDEWFGCLLFILLFYSPI